MKRLLKAAIIIAAVAFLVQMCSGCTNGNKEGEYRICSYDNINVKFPDSGTPWKIIEVSHDGDSHEFVYYSNGYRLGVSHWPSCKYCKGKKDSMIVFYMFVIIVYLFIGWMIFALGSVEEERLWESHPFLIVTMWPVYIVVYIFHIAVEIVKDIKEFFKNRKK